MSDGAFVILSKLSKDQDSHCSAELVQLSNIDPIMEIVASTSFMDMKEFK